MELHFTHFTVFINTTMMSLDNAAYFGHHLCSDKLFFSVMHNVKQTEFNCR